MCVFITFVFRYERHYSSECRQRRCAVCFFEVEVERISFTEAIKTVYSFHTHLLDCYSKVNKYENGNLTTQ